jgi:hypothetical protein
MAAFFNHRGGILLFCLLLLLLLGTVIWLEPPPDTPLLVTLSHPPGSYQEPLLLRLTAADPAATIWYTLDGRPPVPGESRRYDGPLPLKADTGVVLRAVAVIAAGETSPEAVGTFLIGFDPALPVLSLIIAPEDFDDPETGIYANPAERGRTWERPVIVALEDDGGGFQLPAGLRIHGGSSRELDKKSFRLYFRREYGERALTYPLFTAQPERFDRLVLHAGGQDTSVFGFPGWTLMRNALVSALSQQTAAPGMRDRPVFLVINGKPWGIYFVRERLDERFLESRYDIPDSDILDSPERIDVMDNGVAGDRRHWDNLMQFVRTHDLTDPAHYAYVQTQLDIDNLIDYTILQLYVGNFDWPEGNINQFRARSQGGRWFWLPWDTDQTMGFPPGYNNVELNRIGRALVADITAETTGGQTLLLRKLLAQPLFFDQFMQRAAWLLNEPLSPETTRAAVDQLAAQLQPDIPYEQMLWPTAYSWADGVELLRTFAAERAAILRQQLVTHYQLGGTVQVTVHAPTGGEGQVTLNGNLLPHLPWNGIFFQQVPLTVSALPAAGYRFAGWEETTAEEGRLSLLPNDDQPVTFTPRFAAIDPADVGVGVVLIAAVGIDDDGEISDDWVELHVAERSDLRGWRLTDNDSLTATDEGSLFFPDHPALADVPAGTTVVLVTTQGWQNDRLFAEDDLSADDGRLLLYVGNGLLDAETDPWFNLHGADNLALLAPGATTAFDDDLLIAFWAREPNRSADPFLIYDRND